MDPVGPLLIVDHFIKLRQMMWSYKNLLQLCLVQRKLIFVQKLITIVFGPTKIDFQKIFSAFTGV